MLQIWRLEFARLDSARLASEHTNVLNEIFFNDFKTMLKLFAFSAIITTGMFLSSVILVQAGDNPEEKIILRIGQQEEELSGEEFYQWLKIEPVLYFDAENKAEIENIDYCATARFLCDFSTSSRDRLKIKKMDLASADREKIQSYLADLARRVNKDPVNAKFQVEDGKVSTFAISENGLALNIERSLIIISESILAENYKPSNLKELDLAYNETEPEIKSDEIDNLGITDLIGEGKSDFRGSPKNRIHNIEVGSSRFHGALIKPGEEFSFVKILGPVDAEHGYAEELVIKKDKTEPEFGGGICQISTTAFRAAVYSGLEITARRNHAYPVRYYNPQGMDATVYIPRPDLRFINNTPGYILIQTKIEGTNLIFDFYGTSDGRTIAIEGPKIFDRQPDGAMKATFTQIVRDKDGNEILKDTFKSNYDSPWKYPHPGGEVLKDKPANWSKDQWKEYKKANNID